MKEYERFWGGYVRNSRSTQRAQGVRGELGEYRICNNVGARIARPCKEYVI